MPTRSDRNGLITVITALAVLAAGSTHGETLRMAGAGSTHELLSKLGAAYEAENPDATVEVIPNFGSSGGIRALTDGVIDLAVSAIPLDTEQTDNGLEEFASARTAFILVTSGVNPESIGRADVAALFADSGAKWPDGRPVRIVLRPDTEIDTELLQDFFPGMANALAQARTRPEIPIAATDLDNTKAAEAIKGSLTASTLVQLLTEIRALDAVPIDGVKPTLESLGSGEYPYIKTLHFIARTDIGDRAAGFRSYLLSDNAVELMRRAGLLVAR